MARWWLGLALSGWSLTGLAAQAANAPSTSPDDAPAPPAKKATVAHIELRGALPEGAASLGLFAESVETLDSALGRIKKAADDDKLAAILLHVDGAEIGWGKVHELRQAIAHVRAKGKSVYAWLESAATKDYLIACGCDRVCLPESGVLMLPGLRAEITFFKKAFDWLEVQPQMLRVGEYKSAAEPYTRSEMSPQFREEMEALLDDHYRQVVETIAASRKLPAEKVKEIIDQGVWTAAEARERGLIDLVGYEDQLLQHVDEQHPGTGIKLVKGYGKKAIDADFSGFNGMIKMMNLLMGVEPPQRKSSNPKLAVISAVGPIMSGPSQMDFLGDSTMGSSTMIKAIRQARDDATVKAIVLRVDSPGGSALASDLIWHELETVEKPVVVSMGDVAASGGYYIAMGADRIFAEPGTLTGSIGVVGGKIALEKFFAKFGVTTSVVQRGKNSGVLSMTAPFTESEQAAMQRLLNDIYAQFTAKAAKGRKMDVAALEKLARGRVYTGAQAKELGLVDELGTLDDAIAYSKKAAGLEPTDKLERLNLPKPVSPFEQLLGPIEPETQLSQGAWTALLRRLPAEFREPLRDLQAFEILAREPGLTIMPFRLTIR